MEQLACSSFMQWVYGDMGTIALVAVLFYGRWRLREFDPERRVDTDTRSGRGNC